MALPMTFDLLPARSLAGLALTYRADVTGEYERVICVRAGGVTYAREIVRAGKHTVICPLFLPPRERARIEIDVTPGGEGIVVTDVDEIAAYTPAAAPARIDRSGRVEVFVEHRVTREGRTEFAITLDATAVERYLRSRVSARISTVARAEFPQAVQVYLDDEAVTTLSLAGPYAQREIRADLHHDRTYRLTCVSPVPITLHRVDVLEPDDRPTFDPA